MISFRANFIGRTSVTKIRPDKPDCNVCATLVELNPLSKDDINAIDQVNRKWVNCRSLASNIFERMRLCNWEEQGNGNVFYALTTQKKNFATLDPSKILGIAHIISFNNAKVKAIQLEPETTELASNHKYTGVGAAILNSIEKVFRSKNIVLKSFKAIRNFCKTPDFERIKCYAESFLRP